MCAPGLPADPYPVTDRTGSADGPDPRPVRASPLWPLQGAMWTWVPCPSTSNKVTLGGLPSSASVSTPGRGFLGQGVGKDSE